MRYVAIINTPGYMPDSDSPPPEFDNARDAWEYLAQERRDHEDEVGDSENTSDDQSPYSEVVDDLDAKAVGAFGTWDGTGSVEGFTPGYRGDHDLGLSYTVQEAE